MSACELSVVIVNWNVREMLRACLSSIFAGWNDDPGRLEVIVVDNASPDGSAEMVRTDFPQVILIENHGNPGFAVANNQAIRVSNGRSVMLLNPDTEVLGDALGDMVRYLDANPAVGMVAPKLLNSDGSVQSSRRRFPTLATAFLESTVIQQWWRDNRVLRNYYMQDRSDDEMHDVDFAMGACLMVRRKVIDEVGLLDEGFFMYSEEVDWCRRIKQAGWRIVYLPVARVIHHGGQSSKQVVAAQHIHFKEPKPFIVRNLGKLLRFENTGIVNQDIDIRQLLQQCIHFLHL